MIKKIVIFTILFLIIVVTLHVAFFVFINAKGKDIIIGGIERNFKAQATMSSLSVKFPFNLEINNFKCQDLSFEKANVSLGLLNPFARKLVLSKVYIEGLDVKIVKDSQGVYVEPFVGKKGNAGIFESKDSQKIEGKEEKSLEAKVPEGQKKALLEEKDLKQESVKKFSITIGKLYLKDSRGKLSYFLKDKGPIDVTFENIKLIVKNFSYPKLSRFSVDLDASIRTDQGVSKDVLHAKGWVDYLRKNMDLDFNIDSLDYFIFSQHYPYFWKPGNLGIEEASLSLDSNLNSKDNDLVIDGVLSLDKIDFKDQEGDLIRTILAFLQGDKEKPTLHLKLRTKMDSPNLDLASLKNSLAEKIPLGPELIVEGILGKAKKTISETLEEVGDTTESSVDTAIDTIKGVVGSFEDIFKSKDRDVEEKKD